MKHLKLFEQLFESKYKVLHGTGADFDTFEIDKDISSSVYGTKSPDNGLGIFFTDNKVMAEWFAGITDYDPDKEGYAPTGKSGKVINAKIEINKPHVIDDSHHEYDIDNEDDSVQIYFKEIEKAGGADNYRKMLQNKGHDGIILRGCRTNFYADGTYSVYVVFDPSKIEITK